MTLISQVNSPTVTVTVGCSRPGVNHCYIKDRLGVPVTGPPHVYIEALKPHFQKDRVLLLTRPSDTE